MPLIGEQGNVLRKSSVELVKESSNGLRGSIAEELNDGLGSFSSENEQILKFHGIYTQDNRDLRRDRIRAKQEVEHICMVRVALPGGVISAEQYLALDHLASEFGNAMLRLTTRQGIQFHFVTKSEIGDLLKKINRTLLTTWGGCGDVVRNVTACPSSQSDGHNVRLSELAKEISLRYKAPSDAYLELWVDGERIPNEILNAPRLDASIYGSTMLPRKFKIGLAQSSDNCTDVLSSDVGVVIDEADPDRVRIYVGGGMGRSAADESTFARLADLLGEVNREDVFGVIDAIISIQRDNGDRYDRSHARFKYLVDHWGVDKVRIEVERLSGIAIRRATKDVFAETTDHLGVTNETSGHFDFGLKLPSGRIKDTPDLPYLTTIRRLVELANPKLAITAKGDLLLKGISSEARVDFFKTLQSVPALDPKTQPRIFRESFACVALPTCGLALAESERYLPTFLAELAESLEELGLADQSFEVRMTGCPNGCARPYLAEIGIVGRSKRSYDIYLGADRQGTRLGELFAKDVDRQSLVAALIPILGLFRDNRSKAESFGDFVSRQSSELIDSLRPAGRTRLRQGNIEAAG
ncbi:MAG: NADPH-dependent assimilatory sulfite reductase hemoprotein subunit [Acidimicrobiaceae bacterium]|nr:NADPH-dependent assimilatory sulfite reductase hemoprotein subunit [Acidimicrobiaceae bacterium]